jgi:hypothetical protein
MGIGTYGQFIFVSPRTKVVIVRTADEDGRDPLYWREVFQNIAEHVGETYGRATSAPRVKSSVADSQLKIAARCSLKRGSSDVGIKRRSPITPDVPTENNAFTGTVQVVVIETNAKEEVDHLISREDLLHILMARQ